jgi:hypothetical protein
MVALTFDRRAIRLGQNGLHFLRLQIARRMDRRSFGRNAQDFGALRDRGRLPPGHKAEEASQRCQPAVASTDRVSTFLLRMVQKGAHLMRGEVGQCELSHRSPTTGGDESEEQAPGVAIGTNGMDRSIPLLDHPLVEEGVQQPWERVGRPHGAAPSVTCRQCAPNARKRSLAWCRMS